MTSINNALGDASDALLKVTGAGSRPSGWSAREIRREAERQRRRSAKAAKASQAVQRQRP